MKKMKKLNKIEGEAKMEVLELKPVKNKQVWVFLIKKQDNKLTEDQRLILNTLIETYNFKFATISLENVELTHFKHTELGSFLGDIMLPCYNVDIAEYAKAHLDLEITEQKTEISELESAYNSLADKQSSKAESMKSWIDYLKGERSENVEFLNTKLKSQWIVKKILDIIRYYEDSLYYENTLYVVHFTPEKLVLNIKEILEELGVSVIVGTIKVNLLVPSQLITAGGIN